MSIIQSNISIADKYPAYKDSGEYWLGDIPEGWEIKKLKHVFHEKKKVTNPALNCGSISFGKVVYKDDEKIPESTKASYQEVLAGEYLVNPLNLNYDLISLRIGLSDINVVVSSGYIVLKNTIELDKSYFNYLLHRYDVAYMKLLGSGVRQTISFNHIANSLLAYPPKEEQTAIATFLDDKTTKIDRVIAQKQQMIALLKERKQIIIQDLVTGKKVWNEKQNAWVDSRSSSEVEMKDSGVEWIGEIPEGWEVKRLKYVLNTPLKYGANESGIEYTPDLPRYVRITDFSLDGKLSEDKKLSLSWEAGKNYLLEDGDILFARSGATVGKSYQFKKSMSVENHYSFAGYLIKASPNEEVILSDFLNYFTMSGSFENWKSSIFNKATIENIGADKYSELLVVTPAILEQTSIVAHIEAQSIKIDQAIQLQAQQIEKLKELKATLIDGAVTGKIKVPSVQEVKETKV